MLITVRQTGKPCEEEQAYMRMTDEEKAAYDAENETEILTEQ